MRIGLYRRVSFCDHWSNGAGGVLAQASDFTMLKMVLPARGPTYPEISTRSETMMPWPLKPMKVARLSLFAR